MDVVLIQPEVRISHGTGSRITAPLGILSVATPLDVAGYKVRVIDQRIEPNWEQTLLAELKTKPICVGLTSMTGPQIWWGLKASKIVKDNSDVPVVWGGVHASLLPQQTLENPYIDIVVQGEGEETFFELVKTLGNRKPLHGVRGIWYKENGHIKQNPPRPYIDLNKQPPLSYHLINLKRNLMCVVGEDAIQFETSRGCPFNCAFCYNTCFNHRRWRALTAEETLFRIKRVKNEFGIKGFAFSDDNFFASPDRAQQILENLVRENLGIVWGKGDIRLDLFAKIDDDFLRLIERSGCTSLFIGVESGSQRVADLLRKGIDVSQAIPINRRLAKYKMLLKYLFLVGIPGETKEDLAKTAALMLKLVDENPKATVGLQIIVPYPGTELFDIAAQYGLHSPQRLEDWVTFSWLNRRMDYPWLTPEIKKTLQMLSLCSYFMAKDTHVILTEVSPLISLVSSFYRPVAKKRMRGMHDRFLPELKVAELLGFRGY